MVKQFRKRPVVIEAEQFTVWLQDNPKPTSIKVNGVIYPVYKDEKGYHLFIPTLEGNMRADNLDWIIKGVNGEFYPCKPDIFEKTYEEVKEVGHTPYVNAARESSLLDAAHKAANATLTDQDLIDNPHFKDAGFKQGDSVIISEGDGRIEATGVDSQDEVSIEERLSIGYNWTKKIVEEILKLDLTDKNIRIILGSKIEKAANAHFLHK